MNVCMCTRSSRRTRLTEVAPGAAHVVPAAAVPVGQGHRQRLRALSRLAEGRVTPVHAAVCNKRITATSNITLKHFITKLDWH